MDVKSLIEEYHDFLAPQLDTYEQAVYLYALRHSRLQGLSEVVIGFKSARKRMATGIGEKGKPMSEGTAYEKLRSLQSKGCIRIIDSERSGTRLQVFLPSEIPGVIPASLGEAGKSLETLDFFEDPEGRLAILAREDGRCFYCGRTISADNFVLEHVESRPEGSNAFWNVVAACRSCNNRKGAESADDFLRTLYREELLSADDFAVRRESLARLRRRELVPVLRPRGA